MKRVLTFFTITISLMLLYASPVFANIGDMGFYGGISQGRKLPKTTDEVILESSSKSSSKKKQEAEMIYKELILLGGQPVEFEGILTVKQTGGITDTDTAGKYAVTHTIKSNAATAEGVDLKREVTFDVNWRKEANNQVIENYEVKKWTETITTPFGEYERDNDRSNFQVSFIHDKTAGVTYSKGTISQSNVYIIGGDEGQTVKADTSGTIYGYNCTWSSTETHRTNTWIYAPDWQMQYQLRPSVSVTKQMQYSINEPTAISFNGNYTEIIQNISALSYNMYNKPNHLLDVPTSGSINIDSFNNIEQLIAPDLNFLKGHFAEDDIRKLFSMKLLEGETKFYQPDQAMTRGQYVEALAKSVKLPIEKEETKKSSKKNAEVKVIFPDVLPERSEYPYIMAAYNAGLAIGRDNGNFYIDSPIQRQEAIVILIRTLGLENLGLDPSPITPYVDDALIGSWARQEINAATVMGIIGPDSDGKLNPTENITKAEGAAMLNKFINYMRKDMVKDYTDNIINYAD